NQSVTFTATVGASGGGTPTGTVVFSVDSVSAAQGTLTTAGGVTSASFSTSTLAIGTHTITASYAGGGNFVGSAGSLTQMGNNPTMVGTGTALSSSVYPSSVFGHNVVFTATVTAHDGSAPTGIVDFYDDPG